MSNISTLKREVKRIQSNLDKVKQSEIKKEPFMIPFLDIQISYTEYDVQRPDGTLETISRYKYRLGIFGSSKEPDRVKLFDKIRQARKKGQQIFTFFSPPKRDQFFKLRLKYNNENPLKIVFKDAKGRKEVFYWNPNAVFGDLKPNQTQQDKQIEGLT